MKNLASFVFLTLLTFTLVAQDNNSISKKLKGVTKKGDYIILELRLNKEDEFRTIEGSSSSLSRIAVYAGSNEGMEVVSKGFEGMNSVVSMLNNLKSNGWLLDNVYTIKGDMLIITHYVLERRK